MSTIVTRYGKGSPLTWLEVDNNFTNLNTDKIQSGDTVAALTITSATINGGSINSTSIGATTASTGRFSDITDTGLTSGRVTYASTGGNLVDSANLTFNGTTLTSGGYSTGGNLTFTGTGNRITGDFSNATASSRVAFQTSTTNGNTGVYFLPNGTSTTCSIQTFNTADPTNSAMGIFGAVSTDIRIQSGITGTGTYLPMTFFNGGSERMRIDTSGNVGIGATPAAGIRLDVRTAAGTAVQQTLGTGSNASASTLSFLQTGSTQWDTGITATTGDYRIAINSGQTAYDIVRNGTIVSYHAWSTGGSERMRIDSSGNINIATAGARITGDFSNATFANRVAFQSSTTNGQTAVVAIPNGTGTTAQWQAYNNSNPTNASFLGLAIVGTTDARFTSGITGTGTYLPMTFYTGGSEAMRIDTSRNVGIGTSSVFGASTRLDVRGTNIVAGNNEATVSIFSTTAQAADVGGSLQLGGLYDGTNYLGFAGIAGRKANSTSGNWSGYLQFLTREFGGSYAERMRIDSSGNVGIGTNSPGAKLHVNSGATDEVARFEGTGTPYISLYDNGTRDFYILDDATIISLWGQANKGMVFATNGTERMRIHASGGVSIGNTTDSGAGSLNVNGSLNGGYIAHAAGTTAMAFGADNVVRVTPNATATYTTTVPAAGAICVLSILTSGTTSYTITFGTGFKSTGTLATGTVSARYFNITFVSDGTNLIEMSRTVAIA